MDVCEPDASRSPSQYSINEQGFDYESNEQSKRDHEHRMLQMQVQFEEREMTRENEIKKV